MILIIHKYLRYIITVFIATGIVRSWLSGAIVKSARSVLKKSALSVERVSLASWNILDNKLYLAFDTTRTHLDEISVAVAKAGYDTNLHKAGQSIREQMPQCCKFKP